MRIPHYKEKDLDGLARDASRLYYDTKDDLLPAVWLAVSRLVYELMSAPVDLVKGDFKKGLTKLVRTPGHNTINILSEAFKAAYWASAHWLFFWLVWYFVL